MQMKEKLTPQQIAGRARWAGVSIKKRKEYMSEIGKKGAKALWEKYEIRPKSEGGDNA